MGRIKGVSHKNIYVDGVTIGATGKNFTKRISSKSDFFLNKELIVEFKDDYLILRLPDFDEQGVKVSKRDEHWRCLVIRHDDNNEIPISGHFPFEPNSTDSVKYVYLGKEDI